MSNQRFRAAVVVTSDTCAKDASKDTSGAFVCEKLKGLAIFDAVEKTIVEDDRQKITDCLVNLMLNADLALIITVGGTGLCPRDVTPEATSALYDKSCSGIATALHVNSLKHSPHAALSRLTAGIRGQCLIVNFPGKQKACEECLSCLKDFLEHALEQVRFNPEAIKETHLRQQQKDEEEQIISSSKGDLNNAPKSHSTKPLAQQSPYPLIGYYEALGIMNDLSYNLLSTKRTVRLTSFENAECILGDVLADDLKPVECFPRFTASTMDGYVVNVPPRVRNMIRSMKTVMATLIEGIEAFEAHQKSQSTKFVCYQVNTGGRLPERDFAVVPAEKSGKVEGDTVPLYEIKLDTYIRPAGSDITSDDLVEKGTVIGPVELSLIIALGHKSVNVLKKPRLGVISNGDELVEFHSTSRTGENSVIDTNSILLTALFKSRGLQIESFGITRDEPEQILLKINDSIKKCDILIVTGGASMGTRDHVKDVIERIGGTIHFGRVNIKPGKPASFSSLTLDNRRKFIFSLPGNPVSAYVTSLVLVLPFIEYGTRKSYSAETQLDSIGDMIRVKIDKLEDGDQSYEFDGRLEFVRARFTSKPGKNTSSYMVSVSTRQQSSRILNLKGCDCLIMIDPSLKGLKFLVGQTYQALKLRK